MGIGDTVLVTGATGFVGSRLCRALLAEDRRVRALHRPTSNLSALEGLRLELITGDILDPESLARAVRGADLVFHVAAESAYWRRPDDVLRSAVAGTRYVLEATLQEGVTKVVLTSSVAAMGVPLRGELLTEGHTFGLPQAFFPYGYAKYQSELTALRLAEGRLHLVIVNPSIVLGPGDLYQISGSLITETARGRAFVYNDGGANYIHVDDVAAGHLAAATHGRPGERYILGGENRTHYEALTAIAQMVGVRPPWLRIPNAIVPAAAGLLDLAGRFARLPMNGAQMRISRHRLFVDTTKAQTELGFSASRTFLQSAQEAYDWYRSAGMI
jgi:dihydroflavonol-4-reductase